MIRLLGLLPLAVATVIEASRGNTFAIGLALATIAPLAFIAAAAIVGRAAAAPRKADPAKIARMERELGIGPAWEGKTKRDKGCVDPDCPHEHYTVGGTGQRVCLIEVPTTVAKPAAHDDGVCPRSESCVMAHSCRRCGADRGQACVGDLHLDTRALAQPE